MLDLSYIGGLLNQLRVTMKFGYLRSRYVSEDENCLFVLLLVIVLVILIFKDPQRGIYRKFDFQCSSPRSRDRRPPITCLVLAPLLGILLLCRFPYVSMRSLPGQASCIITRPPALSFFRYLRGVCATLVGLSEIPHIHRTKIAQRPH